jgi:hypothetical protein
MALQGDSCCVIALQGGGMMALQGGSGVMTARSRTAIMGIHDTHRRGAGVTPAEEIAR